MAPEVPSGHPEPTSRISSSDTPQTIGQLIQNANYVEGKYANDPEFQEKIIFFTKQTRIIRLAYETKLLSADEHDRLQGVLMAEKDRGQEIDELTDIYRKLAFMRRLDEQTALAKRNNTPLTVAFVDLDRFGKINKRYSHMHGDAVINQVANYYRSHFRRGSDILGRYGGEEIGIIMPNTDEATAYEFLQTINQGMSSSVKEALNGLDLAPPLSPKRKITASIGLAQVDFSNSPNKDPLSSGMQALRLADDRMNLAKTHGRNTVVDTRKEQTLRHRHIRLGRKRILPGK
jgi:diguanylate cyclase (GGDEF)-like protein